MPTPRENPNSSAHAVPAAPEGEPFAQFMERALYDPKRGYYTRNVRGIGRGGDFTTTPALSQTLGRAIHHWAESERRVHDGGISNLIEVGAGGGHLMASLRRAGGWKNWLPSGMRYHIVDRSPTLISQQKKHLGSRHISWHQDLPKALDATDGEALIISNELPDAFPATVLQWDPARDDWSEVWISKGKELYHPYSPDSGHYSSALEAWGKGSPPPNPSQRIELGLAYRDWLSGWLPLLKRGSLLTIDYGDVFPEIYTSQPLGSLRAYFHQQRLTGTECYQNPGHQDLTCDVNFTDLQRWGEDGGLETVALCDQSEFFRQNVREKEIDDPEVFTFLTDPRGAGTAFKVLHQRRHSA